MPLDISGYHVQAHRFKAVYATLPMASVVSEGHRFSF